MDPTFSCSGELWLWPGGNGTWVFVTVPADDSEEIKNITPERNGFGSVKVRARIDDVEWSTSIFPDSASGCFFLPVKKAVRTRAGVDIGDWVDVEIDVLIT